MKTKELKGINYDLGCGSNKQKGFIGVDIIKKGTQANIEWDLFHKFPWEFAKDNSVNSVFASHVVEHIPHGDGYYDPFYQFMDECYRILKPGGTATFITPYYTSMRAFQDPTHLRFIGEASYLYVSKKWREDNKLAHYPIKCDFEVMNMNHAVSEEFTGRAQEAIQYAASHNWNVVNDLIVVLKKI